MCWARYSKGCASFTRSLVTLVDAVMTVAFFLWRDVDSSLSNAGFILVPRSDSVVFIYVIVLRTDVEY